MISVYFFILNKTTVYIYIYISMHLMVVFLRNFSKLLLKDSISLKTNNKNRKMLRFCKIMKIMVNN